MDKILTLSSKEISRLEALQRIKDKRITQKEAARMLNMSVRQVRRLNQAYKAYRAKGLSLLGFPRRATTARMNK